MVSIVEGRSMSISNSRVVSISDSRVVSISDSSIVGISDSRVVGISDSRGNSIVGDSRNLGKSSRDSSKSMSIVDVFDNRSRGNLSSQNLSNSVGLCISFSFSLANIMNTMSTGNWFIGSIYTRSRFGSMHKRGMDTSSISDGGESSVGVGDRGVNTNSISEWGVETSTICQVGQRISFSFSFSLANIMNIMSTFNWFIGSIHTGSRFGSIYKRSMDTSTISYGGNSSIGVGERGNSSLGVGDRGNSSIGVGDRGNSSLGVGDR